MTFTFKSVAKVATIITGTFLAVGFVNKAIDKISHDRYEKTVTPGAAIEDPEVVEKRRDIVKNVVDSAIVVAVGCHMGANFYNHGFRTGVILGASSVADEAVPSKTVKAVIKSRKDFTRVIAALGKGIKI